MSSFNIRRCLAGILVIPSFCLAAEHYVRAGGTCTSNCNSWSAASNSLTTALANASRGDTIWVGDGSYPGSITFGVPESGTTLITIRKATIASHGTSTGWSDSYGDGVASFPVGWHFATGYWLVDGQVGQGATLMNGVAGTPDYVPYGFEILKTSTSNFDSCIQIGGDPPVTTPNVTIRHTRCGFLNTPGNPSAWGYGQDGIYIGNSSDITLSYMWIHDLGRCAVYQDRGNRLTVEHSVVERNGHYGSSGGTLSGDFEHSEISAMWHDGQDLVWRYNVIRDYSSTGGLMLMGTTSPTLYVYGNVFTNTGYWKTQGPAHGFVNGLDTNQTHSANAWIYDNTFINTTYASYLVTLGDFATRVVKNNIFYNAPVLNSVPASSYNWWFNSGTPVGSDNQIGTGDPFVNSANNDWRLAAPTAAADTSVGSAYAIDPLGVVRGADGTWDRGAFEYSAGSSTPAPAAPTGLVSTVR